MGWWCNDNDKDNIKFHNNNEGSELFDYPQPYFSCLKTAQNMGKAREKNNCYDSRSVTNPSLNC